MVPRAPAASGNCTTTVLPHHMKQLPHAAVSHQQDEVCLCLLGMSWEAVSHCTLTQSPASPPLLLVHSLPQADKKLDLWSLPEVLVVHLKRFSYTRWNRDKLDTEVGAAAAWAWAAGGKRMRLRHPAMTARLCIDAAAQGQQHACFLRSRTCRRQTHKPVAAAALSACACCVVLSNLQVLFPLQQLDLSRYVLHAQEQPPIYDCYAVSNHYGGLGGGHYTAFAQMPDDKKWYCFDDSRVEEMTAEGVSSRQRQEQGQGSQTAVMYIEHCPHMVDAISC